MGRAGAGKAPSVQPPSSKHQRSSRYVRWRTGRGAAQPSNPMISHQIPRFLNQKILAYGPPAGLAIGRDAKAWESRSVGPCWAWLDLRVFIVMRREGTGVPPPAARAINHAGAFSLGSQTLVAGESVRLRPATARQGVASRGCGICHRSPKSRWVGGAFGQMSLLPVGASIRGRGRGRERGGRGSRPSMTSDIPTKTSRRYWRAATPPRRKYHRFPTIPMTSQGFPSIPNLFLKNVYET